MRKKTSKILFVNMVFAPILILGGLSFFGKSVPVENQVVTSASFLENSSNLVEVVYFGYVGCAFICPTSLYTVGEVIDEINAELPGTTLGGYFVDVNTATQPSIAHEYSRFFSDAIVGVNTEAGELENLRSLFGITVFETNRDMDEIIHTDHYFIVTKKGADWRIAKILANDSSRSELKSEILLALKEVSDPIILANY